MARLQREAVACHGGGTVPGEPVPPQAAARLSHEAAPDCAPVGLMGSLKNFATCKAEA
jgi:hypothetical protein